MPGYVLLDYVKMDHAERIRKAEQDRLLCEVLRTEKRPSLLKSLLLTLTGS
jgi:hypothetical protein